MHEVSGTGDRCKHIDGLAFARDARALEVSVGLAELDRLSDSLVSSEGSVVARLEGSRFKDGKSFLYLSVRGTLILRCQRCLGEMPFPLDIRRRLQLVASEVELPEGELEDDSADVLVSEREMSVLALVEDEILLALPMIPSHEICSMPEAVALLGKEHPFAGLAKFKKH